MEATACLHCQSSLDPQIQGPFCCTGCRIVYGLLHAEGLERYYELQGGAGRAATDAGAPRDTKWVEPIAAKLAEGKGLSRVTLDVQGLHCSGCVWLIESLLRRAGGAQVVVDPSVGRLHLVVAPTFDLRAFVQTVERFGYLLGPPLKTEQKRSNDLLWRMGVCIAIAMNSMIFAISTYAGLADGGLYHLFQRITFALSFLSMLVGGSVFIRSAWEGLKRKVLHLDLPIALGVVLAFVGSVHSYFAQRADAYFLDTVNVFLALMLVGRFLQQRAIEKNRLAILASDGTDGLLTRRVTRGREQGARGVETVRCAEIVRGDTLLLAPGDLVPVESAANQAASFSLDWINGESVPRVFEAGDTIPAGAFHVGAQPVEVSALAPFAASPLIELLRTPLVRESDAAMSTPWWQRFARVYVGLVLVAAALGFALWMARTGSWGASLDVATAVLIVTCPCAFGIAMPLANELVQAGLRRAGLFVRAAGFLERAAQVKKGVFAKTGTLTSGALALAGPLPALDPEALAALGTMAMGSNHPKSVAVRRALEPRTFAPSREVTEVSGKGVILGPYRLGAPSWCAPDAALQGDLAFTKDGQVLADIVTVEEIRPDAREEIAKLSQRHDVYLLSGDSPDRVRAMAAECGVPPARAIGGRTPEGKAAWARAHDAKDLLMVGDGVNDSYVVERAFTSGTPAIDRPFMAAKTDFYFVSPGLRPVRLALNAARALLAVRRRNLIIAVAYNVVAIALAYAGVMSPLVCAVFMPVSSLTTIAATSFALSRRASLWRS